MESSGQQGAVEKLKTIQQSKTKVQVKFRKRSNKSLKVIYQCNLCSFQCTKKYNLKKHFVRCLNRDKPPNNEWQIISNAHFKCEYCQFVTHKLIKLMFHKIFSHAFDVNAGFVKCKHCRKLFFTREDLQKHMRRVLKNDSNEQSSNVKIRERVIALTKDFECEVVTSNGTYVCPCKNFKSPYCSIYINHLKKVHQAKIERREEPAIIKKPLNDFLTTTQSGSTGFSCNTCSFSSKNEILVNIHNIFNHHRLLSTPVKCLYDQCQFQSRSNRSMQSHILKIHNHFSKVFKPSLEPLEILRKETFQCPELQCIYSTNNITKLLRHRCEIHGSFNIKVKFTCPESNCLVQVSHKLGLMKHLEHDHKYNGNIQKVALSLRTFQCLKCKFERKNFKDVYRHLEKHMKIVKSNNEETKLICQLCDFQANSKKKSFNHGLKHCCRSLVFFKAQGQSFKGFVKFGYPLVGVSTEFSTRFINPMEIAQSKYLKNKELNDIDDKLMFTEELIRIEITEDDESESTLNPTTGELFSKKVPIPALPRRTNRNLLRLKCQNAGCVYYCQYNNMEKMQEHSKICKMNPAERKRGSKSITLYNSKDIYYKCSICGAILVTKPILDRHTFIHAKSEGTFENFKVEFQVFQGDKKIDDLLIEADPKFVPRSSSNVPLSKEIRSNAVYLEYDPEKPVFACDECNFKTNEDRSLAAHKKLHWTAEKQAAFDAKRWYTCSVCFFHCFDIETLEKHQKRHRKAQSVKLKSR
ncbi:hypothetical protein ABEB36_003179 [Hypothenemus hampei]|uniref:C2H2-type domain-containing protein n=1 Tax=Hypothenemus hampei TaxID=57062 RepID=A0ABD1F8B3_HYPHA